MQGCVSTFEMFHILHEKVQPQVLFQKFQIAFLKTETSVVPQL